MPHSRTVERPRLARQHALDAGMQPGHHVQMLADAFQAWQVLVGDLEAAQHAISAEVYLMADDAVGQAFAQALERARQRGVVVRIVLDGLGSFSLSVAMLDRLRAVGVEVKVFAGLRPTQPWHHFARRNHRKVFVIDDHIAHVGGRNLSRDYYALSPTDPTWTDLTVRVEGPLVADISRALRAGWTSRRQRSGAIRPRPGRPISAGCVATAALNHGHIRGAEASRRYLQAARAARHSLLLAQSYFVPEIAMRRAIRQAALRGVDVRILVPDLAVMDVAIVSLASMHALGGLLGSGVRVFLAQQRMMHAKFGVVDGHWWTAGSDNLDPLSRQRNLEANIVGLGASEATQLTQYFETLCAGSVELTLATWHARPWWQKLLGAVAWAFRAFL